MFKGSHVHLMDNKGRISIPTRYREVLQESQDRLLILTNWEDYILAFPQSEWVKVEARLAGQPLLRKDLRLLQRFLMSGVEECPLDRQGRILIPPTLRDYAQLSREVALVGAVRCFEIWDRTGFEAHRKLLKGQINEEVLHELLI